MFIWNGTKIEVFGKKQRWLKWERSVKENESEILIMIRDSFEK